MEVIIFVPIKQEAKKLKMVQALFDSGAADFKLVEQSITKQKYMEVFGWR